MTTAPEQLLYTPEEAARALRIGRTRLYQLLASGEIASIKLGGSRRITPAALRRYVEALATAEAPGSATVVGGRQDGLRQSQPHAGEGRQVLEPGREPLPQLFPHERDAS